MEIINTIGKFSNKNNKFLRQLKKRDIEFENIKKTSKNIIIIEGCKITFDYSNIEVKTQGDCKKYLELM